MSTPQSPRSRQRTEAHEPTLELNSLRVPTISTTSRDSRPFEDSRIKTERDDNSSTARRGIQYPPATDDARPNAAGNDLGVSSHRKPVICENFNGLRKLDDTASRYVDGDVNHYIRLCTRNVSNDGFIHACPGHNTRDHDLSNCPELKKWKAKELFHWLVESRNGKPPFYYNYPLWKLWPGKWDKTPPSRLGPLRPQTPAYALSLRGKQEDITQSIPDPFWDEPHSDSEMMLEMECILPKDSDLDNAAPPSTSCLSHRAQGTENSKANVKQVEIGNTSSAKGSLGGFHRPTEIARQSSRLRIQGFGVHEPPARQSRSPSNQTGHHRHRDHRSKSPVFRRQSPSDLHSASQEHVYLQQPYRTRSTWRDQAATVEDFRSNGRLAQMFSQEGSRDVSLETDHMVRDTARHGRLDNMSGRGGMPALYDSSSRSPGRFSPRDNPEQYDIRSRAHQQDHRVVHPLMANIKTGLVQMVQIEILTNAPPVLGSCLLKTSPEMIVKTALVVELPRSIGDQSACLARIFDIHQWCMVATLNIKTDLVSDRVLDHLTLVVEVILLETSMAEMIIETASMDLKKDIGVDGVNGRGIGRQW
ncbi:hypothetical protein BDZ45DRAFT_752111 [Acephala macrosclerotiorum]|nr:hypothetical protein BDZ45DRAFT_752111 [Acephala macrosclerotiorum]